MRHFKYMELATAVSELRELRAAMGLRHPDPQHEFLDRTANWSLTDWARSRIDYDIEDINSGNSNPMFAFEAFLISRELGEPVPECVLAFLEHALDELWVAYNDFRRARSGGSGKLSNHPERALVAAFGMTRGRGQKTVWEDHDGPAWADIAGSVIGQLARLAEREGAGTRPYSIKETELVASARRSIYKDKISFSRAWELWSQAKREAPWLAEEIKRAKSAAAVHRKAVQSKR